MTWVHDFEDGNRDQRELLGGKGANLAEMTRLGLPVPPGFTITTEACKHYFHTGELPDGLLDEVTVHIHRLEEKLGKTLGDDGDPLLVSVRSGAPVSMPGMMDTILDLGLNDETVRGLEATTGDRKFALDSYRRFVQMFATTAHDVDGSLFDKRLALARQAAGVGHESDLTADAIAKIVDDFKTTYEEQTDSRFPQDPQVQLRDAIEAVFRSWNGRRAREYRRLNDISDELGTAVSIQAMVFGNKGADSGTGVAFTRDPNTGDTEPVVDFLPNAQGEDVVAGIRKTEDRAAFCEAFPAQAAELDEAMDLLEAHERDACDLEFTIEAGTLYLLQVRVAKRTAAAAVRIARELADESVLTRDEALMRITPRQLDQLLHPRFDPDIEHEVVASGVAASPGAASGIAVFDADMAEAKGRAGTKVILVREMTSPDDLHGMAASQGILTAQGGNLSHAAIVAKSMGLPAVCGADIEIDEQSQTFTANGQVVHQGDVVSIDGTVGEVSIGEVPVIVPDLTDEFDRFLQWADERRRLEVRANADLPEDCRRARGFGATGVGLCRTEHMFLGDRLPVLRSYITAVDEAQGRAALEKIREMQRTDFVGILEAMDGLPVTIRLLDPPLHEFLPPLEELVVREALHKITEEERAQLPAVRNLREENPMLGFRGCRLGIIHPELYRMQVAAIADAVIERIRAGGDPHVEIMIPLVAHEAELEILRRHAEEVWAEAMTEAGLDRPVEVGTMIEVPRAALIAADIARHADFFSFGTNDLTQMTWGFSRDDAERHFLAGYLHKGVLTSDPFETLDSTGVGRLIEIACREGRSTNPDLPLGICGEHGGDPASIEFCHRTGLDYVSCSAFRVPAARLAAAQAQIAEERAEAAGG